MMTELVDSKNETTRFVDVGLVRIVRIARVACSRANIVFLVVNTQQTAVFFSYALYESS